MGTQIPTAPLWGHQIPPIDPLWELRSQQPPYGIPDPRNNPSVGIQTPH